MYIKKIKLNNFRNYKDQEIFLIDGINLFLGENAQGKTNIIESIYVSSFGKSYRTQKDIELVNFNSEYFRINLEYIKKDKEKNIEVFINDKNKVIKKDNIKIDKLSNLLGELLVVMFSPDDLNIIKGNPLSRRKFLDTIACQVSKKYMISLIEYNNLLKLKNSLLKKNLTQEDINYIKILHEKMSQDIFYITKFRKELLDNLLKKSKNIHLEITNNSEDINIKYISEFVNLKKEQIKEILDNNLKNEIYRKFSLKGIQKDDIDIYINDLKVEVYGSQGQKRTVLLTLKLANFELIKELNDENPVLLLDDIMSELDNNRINFLLKYIKGYQSIITTTSNEFIKDLENIKITKIFNGNIVKE
jgi:DNA replication and repair protein RecF